MEFGSIGSLFGLIIFILDVMAIFSIITNPGSILYKLGWSLVIILLPLIGLILYAIFGGFSSRRVHN